MKTRIKKITLKDGSISYIPQIRCFFLWCDLIETETSFLETAQREIDLELRILGRREDTKVIKTEYIKYP
jgi:hypothetical protein